MFGFLSIHLLTTVFTGHALWVDWFAQNRPLILPFTYGKHSSRLSDWRKGAHLHLAFKDSFGICLLAAARTIIWKHQLAQITLVLTKAFVGFQLPTRLNLSPAAWQPRLAMMWPLWPFFFTLSCNNTGQAILHTPMHTRRTACTAPPLSSVTMLSLSLHCSLPFILQSLSLEHILKRSAQNIWVIKRNKNPKHTQLLGFPEPILARLQQHSGSLWEGYWERSGTVSGREFSGDFFCALVIL